MELRAQKPLEKIKVKELCDLACINKSTFYAHYQDIYALANAMEDEMVEEVVERPGKCSERSPGIRPRSAFCFPAPVRGCSSTAWKLQ